MNKDTLRSIETERLIIRPVQIGDEVGLHQAICASLDDLTPWMPWAREHTLATTQIFIGEGITAWSTPNSNHLPMVVVHKADNTIIAASGFNERSEPANGFYEIGYWCHTLYQGKGYVSEYVQALAHFALHYLHATCVAIRMERSNSKSIAVAKRLGFSYQGSEKSTTNPHAQDWVYTCSNEQQIGTPTCFKVHTKGEI